MSIHRIRLVAVLGAFAVAWATPMIARACSIAFVPPKPLHISQADLRFGFRHVSTRAAWVTGKDWVSSRPYIDQQVRLAGWPSTKWVQASFRQQQTLKVAARWPENGAQAVDDSDATTPTCQIAGQPTWSRPTILVHETPRAIVITSVSRQTKGSREGCAFGINSCADVRSVTFRLRAPVGNRRIYRSQFA